MKNSGTAMDRNNQLQEEAMRQLDLIANRINSGELTADEGALQANEYLKSIEAMTETITQENHAELPRTKRRTQFVMLLGLLTLSYLAYKFYVLFTGPAP